MKGLYDKFDYLLERGTVWLISDTHFGDTELSKYMERPSDEEILKNIKSKVGKHDTLICLGDCGDLEPFKSIRGYKILIIGNHDTGIEKYREVFDEVYDGPLFIGKKILLSHEPIELPYAFNIHGHIHTHIQDESTERSLNICLDAINYTPVSLNQLLKSGFTSKIEDIHRVTIDSATQRKYKLDKKAE